MAFYSIAAGDIANQNLEYCVALTLRHPAE
jgi:hypothetical protein